MKLFLSEPLAADSLFILTPNHRFCCNGAGEQTRGFPCRTIGPSPDRKANTCSPFSQEIACPTAATLQVRRVPDLIVRKLPRVMRVDAAAIMRDLKHMAGLTRRTTRIVQPKAYVGGVCIADLGRASRPSSDLRPEHRPQGVRHE